MLKYIFIFLICISSIQAQTYNEAKLDSLFNALESNNKGMGSFSIFSNGEEIYQKSFGFSNVATNAKANSLTKYRIGSISKTYTATILMQLVEEEKISLTTLVSDYFPNVPNADKITIENLLRHRSGLFNITETEDLRAWVDKLQSREKMIARIIANGTNFEPDEKTQYSNTNYVLLSFIAEEIEKKDFSTILDERIVEPLALKRTEYGNLIEPKNNEALPFYFENSEWKEVKLQTHMSVPKGAGAVVATPTELNQFFTNLFAGKLVSAVSLESMKNAKEGMGLGLMKLPFDAKEVYGHGGSIDGFQAFAAYFPNENVSIALTTNNLYAQISGVFIGAVKTYFGMDYTLPDFSPKKTIEVTSEELDTYIGTYGSPDFPIDIYISKDGNTLIAQGEGQPSFQLDAIGPHTFYSEKVMIKLTFQNETNKVVVNQGGRTYELTKE
ncbi:serine hydrolase domain-containing protein [uncultured Marixanthomonas sp.]|uniref:serine hydrolase domain-containing protein n=1 Tax=uncultured Marixanthomonas sp. TaxID=757245 RepID=UPI0030D77D81|tara:strand:+ start:22425 stop:23750 length:1326 start_codon:yes stop_codon:yes gene_type:complete